MTQGNCVETSHLNGRDNTRQRLDCFFVVAYSESRPVLGELGVQSQAAPVHLSGESLGERKM